MVATLPQRSPRVPCPGPQNRTGACAGAPSRPGEPDAPRAFREPLGLAARGGAARDRGRVAAAPTRRSGCAAASSRPGRRRRRTGAGRASADSRSGRRPGAANAGGPVAGHLRSRSRVRRRAAVAELSGHRNARGAAAPGRHQRAQHRRQRHRAGQRDAAPAGRPLGPGARHRPRHPRPRHAAQRQRDHRRADGGNRRARPGAARRADCARRSRTAALGVAATQLRPCRGTRGADRGRRRRRSDDLRARQRRDRGADQLPARPRHCRAADRNPQARDDARRSDPASAHRVARRHRQR